MSIRVGLIGFGRTGSIVASEIIKEPAMSLSWVCRKNISSDFQYASHALGKDSNFAPFITAENINDLFLKQNPVDVIIDFSHHQSVKLYETFSKFNIAIVSAISNYSTEELKIISKESHRSPILHSPNITLGINWLMLASKLLRKIIPHADIEIVEEHFRDKKDASGTALRIAEQLQLNPKKHVNSIRVGGIVGKHEIIFGLPYQTIRLTHESINRAAFGTGAIFAAKWLIGKTPGLYSMEEVLQKKFIAQIENM